MATILSPFGLSCVGYAGASKPRPSSTYMFPIASGYAGTIGNGDPVALSGGFIVSAVDATAYPPASSAEIILGVFQSVTYQPVQAGAAPKTAPYWLGGTVTANASYAMAAICIDPMQIYDVQANGPLAVTSIGTNFDLAGFANTSTSTGNSGVYLNNAVVANNNYSQVKVLGLAPVTPAIQLLGGNAWGDPYTIVQVVLNSTKLKYGQY